MARPQPVLAVHMLRVMLRLAFSCRLVEEADFRAAQELFGSDKTLDTLEPKCVCAHAEACHCLSSDAHRACTCPASVLLSPKRREVAHAPHCTMVRLVDSYNRSLKDFEEYGKLVAGKYLVAHSRSPQYKALLKTLFKAALAPLPVQVTRKHGCAIARLVGTNVPTAAAAEKISQRSIVPSKAT